MKKFSILFTALIFASSLFASSSPSKVKTSSKINDVSFSDFPEWVVNPESEYNGRLYLTGVGSGIDEQTATDVAKAELIKTLVQKISANDKVNTFADNTTDYASISSSIDTTSELKSITGLKIVNKFKTKENKIIVLAVLKKQDAVDFYSKQILRNDEKISEFMNYAKNNPTLQGIIYAQKAYTLAKDNDYFLYLIDIIDSPFPSDITLSYGNTAKLSKQISEIKKQIPVKVIVENDSKNLIKTAFTECLNKFGIATTEKDNASYVIKAIVDVEKSDSADDEHVFYYYLVTSEMTSSSTQQVINNFSTHGRAGHVNDQGAKNKAYIMLSKDIEKNFKADLLKLAEEN
ncbi:MAG: LPP20 family lipoprotein [Treponema sp.]|nr:LPP20 family lipoprotein [Candidatus Treponema merdequi]